jgi:cytochrome c553
MFRYLILMLLAIAPVEALASEAVVNDKLNEYRAAGAGDFSAERGKTMWSKTHIQSKSGQNVSCATCHGADLTRSGKHARTGKLIEAMSPKVTPERLSDPAKIDKWFLRNCKWTLNRECTPQEKGDFLLFIQNN